MSWGYGCARESYPGVYADVAYYYTWIQERIVVDNSTDTPTSNDISYDSTNNAVVWTRPIKFLTFLFSILLAIIQHVL